MHSKSRSAHLYKLHSVSSLCAPCGAERKPQKGITTRNGNLSSQHEDSFPEASGYSAVASAAYRAGEKILDERTGVTHDYTRKNGVASAVILTPANAPAWCANRAELWNAVEKAERRKNSQLAREFELAIPRELAQDAARETVLNFCKGKLCQSRHDRRRGLSQSGRIKPTRAHHAIHEGSHA